MTNSPDNAIKQYQYTSIMTAGKVKSMTMLLDKALMLLSDVGHMNVDLYRDELRQCRNIIAQLEMSLNLKNGETAQAIFEIYELIYLALEAPTEKSLELAQYLLKSFRETLELKFGR